MYFKILITLITISINYGKTIDCVNYEMRKLVKSLTEKGFIKSGIIHKVFCSLDRSDFVSHNAASESYVDTPLYIGYGATISAPHMHAYSIEAIYEKLKKFDLRLIDDQNPLKFLDVGSGSGFL